jgi:hypothetical protein
MLRHYFWHRQESKKSGSQQGGLHHPQIPVPYSDFFRFFPSLEKYTTTTQLITKRLASTLVYFTHLKLKLAHSFKSRSSFDHIRDGYSWPSSKPKLAAAGPSSSSGQAVHAN